MSNDEFKQRALEYFQTFGSKVISLEATGDDLNEFRQGLRGIAEDMGLDLSGYDEHIKPILDEAAENFDVVEFKQNMKTLVAKICELFEIDPEVCNNLAVEDE